MRRTLQFVLPAALVLVAAGAAWRGGWATITVEDLPGHLVAGEPVELTFTVRGHGRQLTSGLAPFVEADVKGEVVSAPARLAGAGRYTSSLEVPQTGEAAITIRTGVNGSKVRLLPVSAIARGARPPKVSVHETGRRLFVAKGCATCHMHAEARTEEQVPVGPELTERRYTAAYLERLLKDPQATLRPERTWDMPNLGLKAHEIAALTAFINAQR